MNPLQQQVGGSHYKGGAIQPIEFAMANQYDPCIFSALKYVTRHTMKSGLEDLRKGAHFVRLRVPLLSSSAVPPAVSNIRPTSYCLSNQLGCIETQIIGRLHVWATSDGAPKRNSDFAHDLAGRFEALAQAKYGQSIFPPEPEIKEPPHV